MQERYFPIGIQSFEKIRQNKAIYVDKTALVYRLASIGQYYFLSRPRRFGKSLLVSTLAAYFEEYDRKQEILRKHENDV